MSAPETEIIRGFSACFAVQLQCLGSRQPRHPHPMLPSLNGSSSADGSVLDPSQLLDGEAQRVVEEQEERRDRKGEGWTEEAPAARHTHMNTRPGAEAVRRLTGRGEPKIV